MFVGIAFITLDEVIGPEINKIIQSFDANRLIIKKTKSCKYQNRFRNLLMKAHPAH
jgi:hypothetical protein